MAKRALISGITGRDGAYLTEWLLAKGYDVHGLMRHASLFSTDRIDHHYHDRHFGSAQLTLHSGDGTARGRVLDACSKPRFRRGRCGQHGCSKHFARAGRAQRRAIVGNV